MGTRPIRLVPADPLGLAALMWEPVRTTMLRWDRDAKQYVGLVYLRVRYWSDWARNWRNWT